MSGILKGLITENQVDESKADTRAEVDQAIKDFLAKGGQIEKLPPNRVRAKPGMSMASKHIGTAGEIGRKVRSKMLVGKGRNIQGNKPVVNVEESVIYQLDKEDPLNKSEILVLGGAGRYSFEGLRNKARREAEQLAKDLEVDHPGAFQRSAYNIKQLENTLKTIVAAYEEMEKIRRQGGSRSRNIKDLEETDDWSNLSKRDFKRKELEYELRHERNNYAVYINGRLWKVFADERQANNIARSLRNKGKDAAVHLTGLDPTNEGYSAGTVGGAGLGIEKSPMEKVLEKPLGEDNSKQLSVEELATISDEALDKAYGYGRSSPGNTFGWQANLMSAAYAKKMIDSGVTDIEKISDAIHKGWNVTAQKFVQDPDQFSDTEKLRQAGKLDAKLQQRAKLMKINYAQLDNDEQEKDRVVARALLQAIKGEIAETLQSTQGGMGQAYRKFTPKSAGTESLNEYDDHLVGTVINNMPKGLTIDEFYPKAFSEMLYWKYRRAEKDNFLSVAKGWYDEYKQKHNMKEYKTDQRAPMLIKDIDRIENLLYTLPKGLDFNKFLEVALKQYIDNKYSNKEFPEWKTKTKYLYWDAYKKAGKDKPEGVVNKIKGWFKEEQFKQDAKVQEQGFGHYIAPSDDNPLGTNFELDNLAYQQAATNDLRKSQQQKRMVRDPKTGKMIPKKLGFLDKLDKWAFGEEQAPMFTPEENLSELKQDTIDDYISRKSALARGGLPEPSKKFGNVKAPAWKVAAGKIAKPGSEMEKYAKVKATLEDEAKMVNANDPESDGWRRTESAIMKGLQSESSKGK